ncbi:MAG TPA: lysophospholipid acyltransferase family protein [Thermomicrobiales bacterium]|jgi:1-acyl-sn-glycerol-3-phosphate acyltransferase|nr:1-acyl-sn-glycerol-3-phosphate acyltransferase [Chloroflexota bacterium]HQX63533.1 lysophospholipid acyltransferase family protein [Thermomicrobiales bacterium]HBY46687.1 1-acyl-sn-glycerol-3-phosphate acyltransferase [Chloroflexota bacterium]HCG30567.1 1-acyl-sn-glycerol-3-phosphate acyltransferase [Chloroflexota bacterium]HQZ90239.1 lysophospholipid acyltransferase family protein [Thermomicrobiales bacterium]
MIDPLFDNNLSPIRRFKHGLFLLARAILLPILRVLIRFQISGTENVPRSGGAIVICNHLGWFDPILLDAACPRPILFMAKEQVMAFPVLRWFARQAGAFPVKRGTADRKSLQRAQRLVTEGMLVGVYPEGTRSATGALVAGRAGAGLVVVRSGAMVVPCIMIGNEDLPLSGDRHTRTRTWRWPRVTTHFGEPFSLSVERPEGGRYRFDELTDAMMIELARMLPAEYQGVYADRAAQSHPAVHRGLTAVRDISVPITSS